MPLPATVNTAPIRHERGNGVCSCGAALGDSIDWNWHLSNESFKEGLAAGQTGRVDALVVMAAVEGVLAVDQRSPAVLSIMRTRLERLLMQIAQHTS